MGNVAASPAPGKKLLKRAPRDYSQALRNSVQGSFLLLNIWIGVQFCLFVRYYETGGHSFPADRPAGVEGWLPIASLMNLKVFFLTGQWPPIHPAGTLLLIAFVAASWIFRRSFCSWLCPIGTVSEYLWRIGRALVGRNFRVPRIADVLLRSLKYLLLGLFIYAVGSMSVEAIRQFLGSSYGIVDDVKMLNFFRNLGVTGITVISILILASFVIQNFWCRYLCPYGALMGFASLFSPLSIRRDVLKCIDCAKCAKACPSLLPVDQLVTIRSVECMGCMQCVASCPADGALALSAPASRRVPAWAVAAGLAALFVGAYTYGRLTDHWQTHLPDAVYFQLIPHADEFGHP